MSEHELAPMGPFDPATMPLDGIRLIEASAGTGKTFSLAGLYLRLIVERGLDVQDVLVMTFTRAATQELRERLRSNLAKAARVAADAPDPERADAAERFAEQVIAGTGEDRASIARRLREAATRADQATITTIHGFAQRAAAENAFESALPFDRGEQIDDREVQREAATDYWRARAFCASPQQAQAFVELWPSPEALHGELRDVLAKPHAELVRPDTSTLERERRAAGKRWPKERQAFIDCLAEVLEHNGLRANGRLKSELDLYGPEGIAERIDVGLVGTADGFPSLPPVLADLSDEVGVATHAKNAACKWFRPQDFQAVALLARLQVNGRLAAAAHAVEEIHALAARRKRERREYSFDDMIAALHAAVEDNERGRELAQALRRTWPWALVDEFQDTDPLQYAILQRIYGCPHPPAPCPKGRGGASGASAAPGALESHASQSDHPLSPSGGEGEGEGQGEGEGEGENVPPGGLILIGDPKQAIYAFRGGDVFAYLDAAGDADGRYGMATNHRSTPAVVRGLDALFSAGGDEAFIIEGIDFLHVDPARKVGDRELRTGNAPLAGVTAWSIPDEAGTDKGELHKRIQKATIERIAELLETGQLAAADGEPRSLAPSEVAVLVNTNREAGQMQAALTGAGVPAVCVQQESVFSTEAARDLLWLLQAVATPLDSERLRRALITPLFGLRLADLVDLENDESHWSAWTERFQSAHVAWGGTGVQAMLEPFLQDAAGRVLARTDGERRMTDYLHVAERLQEAEHEVFGREGLLRWLETAIDRSSDPKSEVDDADRVRLEDDSDLVQVTTVHKSKGLQWPVVFVPFAPWLGTGGFKKPPDLPLVFHDGESRTVIDLGSSDVGANRPRAVREHKAEQMRSLYVAFTRAEEALFFVHGAATQAIDGPLAWLLHHEQGADSERWFGGIKNLPDWFSAGHTHERLVQLQKASDNALVVEELPEIDAPRMLSRPVEGELQPARSDLPPAPEPWSIFSFSRLAGRMSEVGEEVAGGNDEIDAPAEPTAGDEHSPGVVLWPRGPGFGQAFHGVLENVDFAAWPAPDETLNDERAEVVATRLRQHGIVTEPGDGRTPVADTAALVSRTLHAPLPEIGPLSEIPPAQRRSELEFFLRLGGASADTLLERIAAAGYGSARQATALPALRGLMHGYIDLVVEHDGRFWILDYKTNVLGPTRTEYAPAALAEAVAAHHYDLQYLIYSVALHRYLRQSLAGYDPATHLGGVLYLFVRGLDTEGKHGVFADRPGPELVESIDALLDRRETAA